MSSSGVALRTRGWLVAPPRLREFTAGRPLLRVSAFGALALLGALRWGTLMTPAPGGRMLGLVAVAVALAILGPWLAAWSRVLAVVAAVLAALAMLAIAGLPLTWIRHVRIARSAHVIGIGLGALPRLLVPYKGINEWVRMVINMGAAILLFDAAVMMAFAVPAVARPATSGGARGGAVARAAAGGDLRRAVAALPLIALASVPLTLVPARLPYLQGLLLFVLLAALVWGERLPRAGSGAAVLACAVAAVAAMILAPRLDVHKPWIHYQTLAGHIVGSGGETFDWNQGYGRLSWPQTGREVLEVQAPRPEYWKAENLDVFNATGWEASVYTPVAAMTGVSAADRQRWSETLTVSIGAMKTRLVFGAGEFSAPYDASQVIGPGPVPGTYVADNLMGIGDAYRVRAYTPHPSVAQETAAGTGYPAAVRTSELAVTLPETGLTGRRPTLYFPSFGSPSAGIISSTAAQGRAPLVASQAAKIISSTGEDARALLDASPYARVYALARHLADGATTPYAYITRVMAYLGHGFHYNQNPPALTPYPLVDFLLTTHTGYCQQFAGAMALLLRMGGVPARVSVGFTPGQADGSSHSYVVSDYDAHAWVEAFFPGYGWVTFDPTPAVAPARARTTLGSLLPSGAISPALEPNAQARHGLQVPGSAPTRRGAAHHRPGGGGLTVPAIVVAALLAGLAALVLIPRPPRDGEHLLAELERAFARSGRPLPPHLTLAELEHRMSGHGAAQEYVRALARLRFAGAGPLPGPAQRRAVRAHLRAGLGVRGALRAWWALPPRLRRRRSP